MEYVQHGDLGKRLKEPWKEANAQLITIQLLEGLIIMHNVGITHRDLRREVGFQSFTWEKLFTGRSNRSIADTYIERIRGITLSSRSQDWRLRSFETCAE